MAHDAPPAAQVRITPATATTQRGLATASFSLGFWGMLVFWWYPFGMMIATVGVLLGVITLALGIRAGKDGENLALLGVFLGGTAISMAIAVYRFMQLAFESGVVFGNWSDEFGTAISWIAMGVAIVGAIAGVYSYLMKKHSTPTHAAH